MYVPALSGLGNYGSYPPGGDIYVISGSGDFVQFGWSVHNGATRLFWKEALAGQGETGPTPTQTVSTGYHNFRLLWEPTYNASGQALPGKYAFYIDGSYFDETADLHPYNEPQASVNGEQDNSCGKMNNLTIRNPAPPYSTLWYHTEPSGWFPWDHDNRWTVNPPGTNEYVSIGYPSNSTTGTDDAYGG
jgi:hypothetical protein